MFLREGEMLEHEVASELCADVNNQHEVLALKASNQEPD
jgi:hypothetical protein